MFFHDFTTCEAAADTRERPDVQALIECRNRFIADHPHLRELQQEIDDLMSTTLDPRIRLEIIFMLITEKLAEMKNVFGEVVRLAGLAVSK
jgi:hypothetical protein